MIYLSSLIVSGIAFFSFLILFDFLWPEKENTEPNGTAGQILTSNGVTDEEFLKHTNDLIKEYYKKAAQEGNEYIRTEWETDEQKQPKTRKARRISKRTNSALKKGTQKSKSNNKKPRKGLRVRAK